MVALRIGFRFRILGCIGKILYHHREILGKVAVVTAYRILELIRRAVALHKADLVSLDTEPAKIQAVPVLRHQADLVTADVRLVKFEFRAFLQDNAEFVSKQRSTFDFGLHPRSKPKRNARIIIERATVHLHGSIFRKEPDLPRIQDIHFAHGNRAAFHREPNFRTVDLQVRKVRLVIARHRDSVPGSTVDTAEYDRAIGLAHHRKRTATHIEPSPLPEFKHSARLDHESLALAHNNRLAYRIGRLVHRQES